MQPIVLAVIQMVGLKERGTGLALRGKATAQLLSEVPHLATRIWSLRRQGPRLAFARCMCIKCVSACLCQ